MKLFIKNNCRYCPRTFCCENCRVIHETNNHNYNAECNFCNFNAINVNAHLSIQLKVHINEAHFPFICPFCRVNLQIFDTLVTHLKYACPAMTPYKDKLTNNKKFVTPLPTTNKNLDKYIGKGQKCVTTSTPRYETDLTELENLQENVTPVNNEETSYNNKKKPSCLKYTLSFHDDLKINDSSIKRRVTFSNTIQDIKEYEIDREEEHVITSKLSPENDNEINDTLWHTAIETQDINGLSVNYDESNNALDSRRSIDTPNTNGTGLTNQSHSISGIWSSMSNVFKHIVDSFTFDERGHKRNRAEDADLFAITPRVKRRKFLAVECRKTIHPLPEKYSLSTIKSTCDKATQTD